MNISYIIFIYHTFWRRFLEWVRKFRALSHSESISSLYALTISTKLILLQIVSLLWEYRIYSLFKYKIWNILKNFFFFAVKKLWKYIAVYRNMSKQQTNIYCFPSISFTLRNIAIFLYMSFSFSFNQKINWHINI